jgi:hypothetical protein
MTTFGMEFEVQGVSVRKAHQVLNDGGIQCELPNRIHETNQNWKSVHDGSVANGAEIVSPILSDNRLNEAVAVTKILKTAGARVDSATGFHVHLGANAISNSDSLAQLCRNWYGVHSAIGALVAPSRLRNRFCKVLDRSQADSLAERLNATTSNIGDRSYDSINFGAINRHGTIEIRLHQGTLNGVKAIAWTKFIEAIFKASNAMVDLTAIEGVNPWAPTYIRDSLGCIALIDSLVNAQCLNASTGDWLKNRARTLQG